MSGRHLVRARRHAARRMELALEAYTMDFNRLHSSSREGLRLLGKMIAAELTASKAAVATTPEGDKS